MDRCGRAIHVEAPARIPAGPPEGGHYDLRLRSENSIHHILSKRDVVVVDQVPHARVEALRDRSAHSLEDRRRTPKSPGARTSDS